MPHRLRAATRRCLVVVLLVVGGSCASTFAAEKTDVASLTDPNAPTSSTNEDNKPATPPANEQPAAKNQGGIRKTLFHVS